MPNRTSDRLTPTHWRTFRIRYADENDHARTKSFRTRREAEQFVERVTSWAVIDRIDTVRISQKEEK